MNDAKRGSGPCNDRGASNPARVNPVAAKDFFDPLESRNRLARSDRGTSPLQPLALDLIPRPHVNAQPSHARHALGLYLLASGGRPIVRETEVAGLFVLAGLGGNGIQLAPALGEGLARLVAGRA